jgi:hypothetical protein
MASMKRLALVIATAILAVIATTLPFAQAAWANPVPGQWCYTDAQGTFACLNAWNGGPWVRVYEHTGTRNNNFEAIQEPGNGYWYIEFIGGGSWNGKCVGDAYNNVGRADASLDTCPGGSGSAGWGTNFNLVSNPPGGGQFALYDIHWQGWLCPSNNYSNGSPFYLNDSYECGFTTYPSA